MTDTAHAYLVNPGNRPVEVALASGVVVVPPRGAGVPNEVQVEPEDLDGPVVKVLLGRRTLRVRRQEPQPEEDGDAAEAVTDEESAPDDEAASDESKAPSDESEDKDDAQEEEEKPKPAPRKRTRTKAKPKTDAKAEDDG